MKFVIVPIVLALSAGVPGAAAAQIPSGAPPPTFGVDYTVGTPLEGFEMQRYRDWQLTVSVTVPTTELQAVLPVGYSVINPAAASSTVSIAFVLQERVHLLVPLGGLAAGTYGPFDAVLVVAAARNALGAQENVIIDYLRSTRAAVDMENSIFGAGSARRPDRLRLQLAAEPGGETMRLSAEVTSGRLNIAASAVFAPAMPSSRGSLSTPFRFVDSSFYPTVANQSLRAGTGVDTIVVPAADITFKRDQIRLPHGTLNVLTVVAGRIHRWQDFVQKLQ